MAKPKSGKGAARAPRKPRAAGNATDPKKIVRQLITEKDFNALLRANNRYQKDIDETVGSLREGIAKAVEKQHLHKGAWATYKKWVKREPHQVAAFLDNFRHLLDLPIHDSRGNPGLSLQQIADSAPSLDLEGEVEGEAEAADVVQEEPEDGKVANLNRRRRTMNEAMREPGAPLAGETPTAEQQSVG